MLSDNGQIPDDEDADDSSLDHDNRSDSLERLESTLTAIRHQCQKKEQVDGDHRIIAAGTAAGRRKPPGASSVCGSRNTVPLYIVLT